MKKFFKYLAGSFAALVALVVAALVVVAYKGGDVARRYVEEHDLALLGREVAIGGADISVLHGQVLLTGVDVKEADGKASFLAFDSLFVDAELLPLLAKKVNLQHIHLTGAKVAVLQRDSVFNFTSIIEHFAKADTTAQPEPEDTASSGWEVGLYDVALRHCSIVYRDLALGSNFDLEDVNIVVPGVYFADKQTDVGLNLNFANGGSLHATMAYDVATSHFRIDASLADFSIAGAKPYMAQGVRVGSVDGLLNTTATMQGDFNHIMNFTLSGKSALRDVVVTDDKGRTLFTAKRSSAELVRLNLAENVIHLGRVDGDGMHAQFLIDENGQDNISYFAHIGEGDSAIAEKHDEKAENAQKKPISFIIDQVDMRGMSLKMKDASLPEPFNYQVRDFCVKAANVSLDKPNDVSLSGRLGKTGTMEARWKGSLNDLANQNIMATLRNISLEEFTPYFSPLFAYRITGGNFSLQSQNVVSNNQLQGVNLLEVMNCTVEKDKAVENPEFKVPMKTALYVVKDRNGKISIDLPVSGNITSPEFSYRKIVVKTLLDFLLKVGTAPGKSLAKAFGKSGGFERVAFNPATADLGVETYDQLNQLVAMLKEKPELKASLIQQINYADAETQTARLLLQTGYYLKLHPGKTGQNLDLIDKSAIEALAKDTAFATYARSISPEGERNPQKIATALYADSARTCVASLAHQRQQQVRHYLQQQLGDVAHNICDSIVPIDAAESKGQSVLKVELVEE